MVKCLHNSLTAVSVAPKLTAETLISVTVHEPFYLPLCCVFPRAQVDGFPAPSWVTIWTLTQYFVKGKRPRSSTNLVNGFTVIFWAVSFSEVLYIIWIFLSSRGQSLCHLVVQLTRRDEELMPLTWILLPGTMNRNKDVFEKLFETVQYLIFQSTSAL